jgi:hypothetical protein
MNSSLTNPMPTFSPTPIPTTHALKVYKVSILTIIIVAIGVAIAIACVYWMCCRKSENKRKIHVMMDEAKADCAGQANGVV